MYVLALTSACSHWYSGFQAVGVDSCYKLPYPDQQHCLDQVQMGYEEYQQQRKLSNTL